MRIGELSRRSGLSPDVLRIWERRYGVIRPQRTSGGFRLYSDDDARRVAAMRHQIAAGFPPAVAARMVLAEAAAGGLVDAGHDRAELAAALATLDEPAAQAALDRLTAALSVEAIVSDVVLPALHEIGERWKAGEVSVAQEHFATGILRGRLMGLARGWGSGVGPRALLACPPEERHDVGLLGLGIALHQRGWRVTFLGADTPVDTIADLAATLEPHVIVLALTQTDALAAQAPALADLARAHPVGLAGPGASEASAERIPHARPLLGSVAEVAQLLTDGVAGARAA